MADSSNRSWALVTGGGRGIGRAIALALADKKLCVALVARTTSELQETARACRDRGAPDTAVYSVDLSDPAAVDRLAEDMLAEHSPVDVLINNAGTSVTGNASDGNPDEWAWLMAVNALAPMRLTRRLAPAMMERERGTIVNIGSVAAIEGMKSSGVYAASKFALRGWSLSCYQHLRAKNIKVTLINPAFVDTSLVGDVEGVHHDRMLRPADIAQAVMLAVNTSAACCPEEITLRLTRPAFG